MPNLVPMVVERTSEGERSMDIFSRLGRERIIMVDTDFNPSMASVICAQMLVMDSESKKPIQLHINSPGGEVYSLLHILSTIDKLKAEVHMYSLGLSASCGSILFNYATPGHRYMSKWSRQMLHQPSSGTSGKISDQERALREGVHLKERMTDLYLERNTAGLTREEIVNILDRDTWMGAEESVEKGFADHIV